MAVYGSKVVNGPQQGTPPPPTVSTPGADQGGRPPSAPDSGSPNLSATVAKWKQGIFTQPPQAATMAPASSSPPPAAGAGGAVAAGAPSSPTAAPQPGAPSPTPAPPQGGVVPGTQVVGQTMLPAVPQQHEIATMAPGAYETPVGTLVKSPDGTAKVVLNDQGKQQYRERYAESVKAFGNHPFANDPAAPPPPVNPGGVSFNPFTNTWSGSGIAPTPPGGAR